MLQIAWLKTPTFGYSNSYDFFEIPPGFTKMPMQIILPIFALGSLIAEIVSGWILISWWAGLFLWILALLIMGLITSLVIPIVKIIIAAGWKNMIRGIMDITNSAKREDVLRAGVTEVFGPTLLFDNLMRIVAGNAAPYVVEDIIRDLLDKFNTQRAQRLEDLLISQKRIEKVFKTGYPTGEDLKCAQFRLAKITQFTNPAPLFFLGIFLIIISTISFLL